MLLKSWLLFKKAKISATLQIEVINDSNDPFSDIKYQLDELTRKETSLLQLTQQKAFSILTMMFKVQTVL